MSLLNPGLQRVVDLLWDSGLENSDAQREIVVLGQTYGPAVRAEDVASEDGAEGGAEGSTEGSNLKNYFQNLSFAAGRDSEGHGWPAGFLEDVYTRIWMTYRTRFAPIYRDADGPSPLSLQNLMRGQAMELSTEYFSSDCGWGCMIRTSQSLLANAFLHLRLGRHWRFDAGSCGDPCHETIVSWFADTPDAPFSIHNIVQQGKELCGKKPGEWFGPSAAARSIQSLCSRHLATAGLTVYVGSDSGDIYENELVTSGPDFKPVLVLLGLRLGVESINKFYWDSLKQFLGLGGSVGIAGGRPSSSHYFFGYQGDYLFYLDPHYPQAALGPRDSAPLRAQLHTVHTKHLKKISISDLDPSMLLGVLLQTEDEWVRFRHEVQGSPELSKIIRISPKNELSYGDGASSHHETENVLTQLCFSDEDEFVDVAYGRPATASSTSSTHNNDSSVVVVDTELAEHPQLVDSVRTDDSFIDCATLPTVASDEPAKARLDPPASDQPDQQPLANSQADQQPLASSPEDPQNQVIVL